MLDNAGNYAKELEEDYNVYDAISEVQGILAANETKCDSLKAQYSKYSYLWKRDLNEALKVQQHRHARLLLQLWSWLSLV